jgi:tRNA threonylcarbamoyladenosine biosynthesis protein TsaB
MRVLGIDSATSVASVALVEDGQVLCEERSPRETGPSGASRPQHAEILISLLESVLQRTAVRLDDLSGMAVSIGPGSFTGLRIGLSMVKGLVYESRIPVVGVSTLQASAVRVRDWEGLVCPILDARKKEVYAALFRRSGERCERVIEDSASSPETWLAAMAGRAGNGDRILFLGDGVARFGELIRAAFGDRVLLSSGDRYPSLAAGAAALGEKRLRDSGGDRIGCLEPVYLRPSEAELRTITE